MKKQVIALFLFCIVAGSVQAQNISVGLKGGLNIADLSNLNGDNRLSGHFGLYLRSPLSGKWSIQPELLYSGQGQQFMWLGNEVTAALSYLQIPVMFQYRPIQPLYLEFGPQLGFLLAANYKSDDDKNEADGDFNKVDIGLGFGVGIRATSVLGFYARYNMGLTDVSDENNVDRYNRVGQIGLYVRLK